MWMMPFLFASINRIYSISTKHIMALYPYKNLKMKGLCVSKSINKKDLLFVLLSFLFFLSVSCSKTNRLHLVKNGISKYNILVSTSASADELRAAEFLQAHILQISDCEVPIIQSDTANLDYLIQISRNDQIKNGDGFVLSTKGSRLFIEGGNRKGCTYGVSELLRNYFNIQYYSPQFIVAPKSKNLSLPAINIIGDSPNQYRNVHGTFVKDQNYKDFQRLHEISDMFATGYFVHTFHKLLPWQEYFHLHPEYYAYMNGKRIIDQLCLTNEEVFRLVIEKLEKEMGLQPEKQVWSVSQDDNFSYCQCENCMKIIDEEGGAAGPLLRFVNRVADHFPHKIISTLAYQYSRQAPRKTIPAKNVQIMLCTIELNRGLPIAADTRSASFVNDLRDWGKISNHVFLWDYTVNFAHHISPFPNLHTLQPNIQFFAENAVVEHFQQSNTAVGHEFSEFKSWLLAHLLWNPNANVDALTIEFTDGYYGAAGKWIRKYINHLQQEILKSNDFLDIYGPPSNYQYSFLTSDNIAQYNHYFDMAERAVADKDNFLLHVRTARMALQYAIMEIGKADMFGPRGWYIQEENDFILRPEMLAGLEMFYQTGLQSNVDLINESGLRLEQYYHATKRFIDVQVAGNHAFKKTISADPSPSDKYSGGDLTLLTNGVRGANDFKVHWLGWEARDFTLVLDIGELVQASVIEISTLYDPKSWIMHPASVHCDISVNAVDFIPIGMQLTEGVQQNEAVNKVFSFDPAKRHFRYVRFKVKGTLRLFDWHPSAGGGSWVFIDEIVVR